MKQIAKYVLKKATKCNLIKYKHDSLVSLTRKYVDFNGKTWGYAYVH